MGTWRTTSTKLTAARKRSVHACISRFPRRVRPAGSSPTTCNVLTLSIARPAASNACSTRCAHPKRRQLLARPSVARPRPPLPPLLWLPQRPHAPGEARDGRLSRRVTSRIRFDPRLQLPNRSQDRLLLQRRQRGQLGQQLCVERDVRVMLPPATFRPNQVLLAP